MTSIPATEMYEALFGATEDNGRTQEQWAKSDNHSGSGIWSGRLAGLPVQGPGPAGVPAL
ncbi:hypothetical protein [Peterkaempfera sp. SMS 1(5)a]|uniref:hypothetical protein n=1 Tax=Peterkaempfera podocarpi TaxID=3232308 RepID=UPI003671A29E